MSAQPGGPNTEGQAHAAAGLAQSLCPPRALQVRNSGAAAALAFLEQELEEARAERAALAQREGALRARLFEEGVASREDASPSSEPAAPAALALVQHGPGWDGYALEVAANMGPAQYLAVWRRFTAVVAEVLRARAPDPVVARLVLEQGEFTSQLARRRLDTVMAALMNRDAPREALAAASLATARGIVATSSPAQQQQLVGLRGRLRAAMAARAAELRGSLAGEDVRTLELWGPATLAQVFTFMEACRAVLTPRQRAVMAVENRDFMPDGLQIFWRVCELLAEGQWLTA